MTTIALVALAILCGVELAILGIIVAAWMKWNARNDPPDIDYSGGM